MTEPDRSAPLSVEQLAEHVEGLVHSAIADVRCDSSTPVGRFGPIILDALSAAHADGVRTGRRQALEDAAAEIHDDRWMNWWAEPIHEEVQRWLRERATRGAEAHQDTEGPESITTAKKNL